MKVLQRYRRTDTVHFNFRYYTYYTNCDKLFIIILFPQMFDLMDLKSLGQPEEQPQGEQPPEEQLPEDL